MTAAPNQKRTWLSRLLLCAAAYAAGITTEACGEVESPRAFSVREYGAVADGQTDAGPGIRAAIEAAQAAATPETPAEVILDAGTYRVQPVNERSGYCLPVHQAKDVTIRGAGPTTKLVITSPKTGGLIFGLCERVAVQDLAIDYDPLPFCQGTVLAINAADGHFDLEVAPGYPTPDAENFLQAHEPYGKWGMIMDPAARRIRVGTPDHFMTPRWEHQGGRRWRFFTVEEHYRRGLEQMRQGDAYVHLARGFGSAITAQHCDGIRIENVIVYASPGLAVGLIGNRGDIVVRGLQVCFAPGSDRLLSTDADGVHCQQNRSGPRIENCYFEGMADDAINIYAPPNVLREIRSPTQWLVTPNCIVMPGDRLQVFDPQSGMVRGEVRATDVKIEGRAFLLTIDQPIEGAVAGADHRVADTLYNVDACGAGFQIRHNHMRGNRRYGCLLRAGGGIVEDNTFEDTTGAGVVLTNEPDWPEGPVPWGITVRNNQFLRGGTCLGYADSPHGAALSVRGTRLGHGLAKGEAIRDIVIENNVIQDRGGTALFIGGARGVTIQGNRVRADAATEMRRSGPAILLEQSSHVVFRDNSVVDPRPRVTAGIEIGGTVVSGDEGVQITELETQLAPQTEPIVDRRAAKQ
jgi:hypothetical protein